MNALRFTIEEVRLHERDVTLRLPFRFGIVTLREAPQAFVRCRIRTEDGREGWGVAAELMVPKWFDKNPDLSNEDNFNQLRRALGLYAGAITSGGLNTAFGHYAAHYHSHLATAAGDGLNPLAAGFGPALIDRAAMDALCRIGGLSLAGAVSAGLPGIEPSVLLPEFEGFDMPAFLGALKPSTEIAARHTIGMVDPLTAADQPTNARVGDGLPETLEEVIAAYGHQYFKIKVGGDLKADLDRLKAISSVLDQSGLGYLATLDGNEQYEDVEAVVELLAAIASEPTLARLNRSILFIEQPLHRSVALERDVTELGRHLLVIVDESDATLASFAEARRRGYAGISSKDCKGFYKSLINLARCRIYSEADGREYFMSAEDLTCQAGIAVQQDLALVALLGLGHVERNGHHYVNGMAGAPEAEQARFLEHHPDLYRRVGGRVCTHIEGGKFSIASLQCTGFGTAIDPDWTAMREMNTTPVAGNQNNQRST